MEEINNEDDFSLSNIKSTIHYIITHYEKFLLLLFVCVIIYFVDYITYINEIIYRSPQTIPVLTHLSKNKMPFSKRKTSV
jgi:hypothetical protein